MTPKRFFQIWKYRYHKYIDIILSVCHWLYTCLNIKFYKIFHSNQPLTGILLAEHFGDIVACEPLIRALKEQQPTSKIFWIVKPAYKELLTFNPNVDVIIEEFSVFYSMLLAKYHPFDQFHNCHLSGLRRYDYLRTSLKNPLALSLDIRTDNYFNHGNILEVFAKVGNLPINNISPKIYIPQAVIDKIKGFQLPAKFIVIHCHSNYSPKDWQIYHWEKLVEDLIDNFGFSIIEIGLKSTLKVYHSAYYNVCGRLSLLETAQLIKDAKYFIGIDSGPAHFANAVGTQAFLLFGKLGDFENYMPYSGDYQANKNVKYIIKEGSACSELSYDEVWNVVSEEIGKNVLKEKI